MIINLLVLVGGTHWERLNRFEGGEPERLQFDAHNAANRWAANYESARDWEMKITTDGEWK